MGLPTRSQQIGWVVLLTALAVLAAVRIGCGEAMVRTAGTPPAPLTVPFAPGVMQAGSDLG